MEGLGFKYNAIELASGIHVLLKGAAGVTFLVYENGGATAITLKQSIDGQSEKNLALGVGAKGINYYYASDGIGGVWTKETADANGELDDDTALVKKDTTPFDALALYVDASWLDVNNGFNAVECTVDGGQCVAIVEGLANQRAPANLPAAGV